MRFCRGSCVSSGSPGSTRLVGRGTNGRRAAGASAGPVYNDAMKVLADDDVDALLSVLGAR
ncbi:MAG: hypothetical protein ACR2GH_11780 [Pseudonocardia sp.]